MRQWLVACAAVLAFAPGVAAHSPDEYVQRMRVGVAATTVVVTLDLTPGSEIVDRVLRAIDLDASGDLSADEAQAYGRAVLRDLALTLDGHPQVLTLSRAELPLPDDLRAGNAVIRIDATAAAAASRGAHRLTLHNTHFPSLSVYLANALMPDSDDVRIVRQTRDARQQTYVLEYALGDSQSSPIVWSTLALLALAALVAWRAGGFSRADPSVLPAAEPSGVARP